DAPEDASDSDLAAQWQQAWERTFEAMPDSSRVVLIADTPRMPDEDPRTCLSDHVEDTKTCGATWDDSQTAPAWRKAEQAAAEAQDVEVIDFNDYLCSDSFCPPVISDLIVYRDKQHLSGTFAEGMEPVLDER